MNVNASTQKYAPSSAAPPVAVKPAVLEAIRPKAIATGDDLHAVTPKGVSHEAVLENAAVFFQNHSHMLAPGQIVHMFSEDHTEYSMVLIKMAIGGKSTGLRHLEVVSLIHKVIGEAVAPAAQTDGYFADYNPLHGWHVANGRTGSKKFHGLPNRDQAEALALQENQNRARDRNPS
jgi:hypothetical protein